MPRTFICIEMPPLEQSKLAALAGELADLTGLRWTRPDLMHITIRFLGEVSPDQNQIVSEIAEEAGKNATIMEVGLNRLGAFPNMRKPRVLWAGTDHAHDGLASLRARIDSALTLRGFGHDDHARFSPHVTIARARESAQAEEIQTIGSSLEALSRHSALEFRVFAQFTAKRLTVMHSRLTPDGSVYTPYASFSLAPALSPVRK